MKYLFKSERLGFRNWRDVDKEFFAEMNSNPEVMEFFPALMTREASDALMDRMMNAFNESGFTFFAVDLLENEKPIGFIGFVNANFNAFFTPCIEIGWRLHSKYWGKGFATEGANRCVQYAFEEKGIDEIYSITSIENMRSEHVMKKMGMKYIGLFDHPKIEKGHALESHKIYIIKKRQ